MKKNRSLWKLIFLLVCCIGLTGGAVVSSTGYQKVDREKLWKDVTKANKDGLPKTAASALGKIISSAIKDKAFAEAAKAICMKNSLEGAINGRRAEEQVVSLEKEVGSYPKEMQPIFSAIIGHRYWQYYQQNQWKFRQRTQTSSAPSKDIKTWSLPRIFAEIDKHFSAALAGKENLKSIPIEKWDELLKKGTMGDSFRPTLYDFLAHEALNFYQNATASGSIRSDEFELSIQSPILADLDSFLAWKIKSTDDTSLKLKAIRLFQDLLTFHKDDQNPSARLDLELGRYRFGKNQAYGENKEDKYLLVLKDLAGAARDHKIFARIQAEIANTLKGQGKNVEARRVALAGKEAFPKSVGGRQCFNIIEQIERKSISIQTERVWNHPETSISVNYRNIENVYFRLVPNNVFDQMKEGITSTRINFKTATQLLKKPVHSWSAKLAKTEDYKSRTHPEPIPKNLKKGAYWLIASTDPEFRSVNEVVSCTDIIVSNLAVILRSNMPSSDTKSRSEGGFVLDALSGKPLADITVRCWTLNRRNRRQSWVKKKDIKTDKNGVFRFNLGNNRNTICLVEHGDDTLITGTHYLYNYNNRPDRTYYQVQFFTDRSIYRPGQTVSFKGICYSYNQGKNQYQVLKNRKVNVQFRDVNGKEVTKQEFRTNDFGSFSGSFTAPRERATGRYSLQASGAGNGYANFRIEEYKRPKFQVKVEVPKAEVKLNQSVTVTGKATAYTGAAIDGASVRYRVVRVTRMPYWWYYRCWWLPPRGPSSKEISRGTTKTDSSGKFEVSFNAAPDKAAGSESQATFHYTVYADVIDTAGETRSGNASVAAGYTSIKASVSVSNVKEKSKLEKNQNDIFYPKVINSDWIVANKKTAVSITTQTLNNQPASAGGSITIFHLQGPKKVHRQSLRSYRYLYARRGGSKPADVKTNWSDLNAWPLGAVAKKFEFKTEADGKSLIDLNLDAGAYRVKLETKDKFGKKVEAEVSFIVLDPTKKSFQLKMPNIFRAPNWTAKVGETFQALWGSGYENARCFVEVIHRGKIIQNYWTDGNSNQFLINQKISSKLRGGFTVQTTFVKENRLYTKNHRVDVPWDNKQLSVSWERFRSKLKPGEKATWTATVKGPNAEGAVAEMVATLYDASLDAFAPHRFMQRFNIFYRDYSYSQQQFQNRLQNLYRLYGSFPSSPKRTSITYRSFPNTVLNFQRYGYSRRGRLRGFGAGGGGIRGGMATESAVAGRMSKSKNAPAPSALASGEDRFAMTADSAVLAEKGEANATVSRQGRNQVGNKDLENVQARANLNETAFFFPQLVSKKDGTVKIKFQMPEALTKWRFMGFAHDQELRSTYLTGTAVTAKDLMVQPNPPRFLREGDQLEFTVKVSNQSATNQKGKVRLTFADARTLKSVDSALGNQKLDQDFEIPSKESRTLSWKIKVPDSLGVLIFKAVGSTGRLSDGEEAFLPVLSRRVLVTESIPMPINGKGENSFQLKNLANLEFSESAEHKMLKVQMVSNPSWYAVMALPYLMEYPHQCNEQVFSRLYANKLASHIAQSDPKIKRIFQLWKGTDALDSPLHKNQDVKAVLLQESPWLLDADNEKQARQNLGVLFDQNRLKKELTRAFKQLKDRQFDSGGWSWFPGGRRYSPYITLYITTGFGRLRHLGTECDVSLAVKALDQLDHQMVRQYEKIKNKDTYVLNSFDCMYLYCRSFFLTDAQPKGKTKTAIDYYLERGRKKWLKVSQRQSKAQLALALKRFDLTEDAKKIMRSIKEHSVTDKEMGRFWRDSELMGYWYQAPIETQAIMIEAFDEIMNDQKAVEQCKVWLLKQKQTQDWKTTKATADAVYALLLRGDNLLASDELVQVKVAGKPIKPVKVEAGTGFFEKQFVGPEITPAHGKIETKKIDKGIAWGSAHWQYLEDISKVKLYDDTPLKVTKTLYTKVNTNKGPTLKKVNGPIKVGDELVVRVTVKTDRDMEFVHLKDHRGSGTEPVDVLSKYRSQDGLYYYQSTKDTATHFFIDFLPKGTYVFEYSVRPQLAGRYQTGFANLQSMYAPEFGGHSQSIWLEVEKN